jgi:nitrogen fixation NifU-like protein
MGEELERFVEELESQISQAMRAAYGHGVLDRWMNPVHMGFMDHPDAHGSTASVCGDLMEIFLRLESDRVIEAKFRTNGCGATMACGSFAAELAMGKTIHELLEIKGETILGKMGGLPAQERHCADLAAEALQQASMGYLERMQKTSTQTER